MRLSTIIVGDGVRIARLVFPVGKWGSRPGPRQPAIGAPSVFF